MSVQRGDEDLPVPDGNAAVDRAAATVQAPVPRNFVIEIPELLSGARIERIHFAPRGGDVHHAVDDERRSFLAAGRVENELPGRL